MKKNTKKIIIITIVCIFVFVSLLSIFSNPYRIEKIKLFINNDISTVNNNN